MKGIYGHIAVASLLVGCKLFTAQDAITVTADAAKCALEHQDLPFEQILAACSLTELSDAEKIIIRDLVAKSREQGAKHAVAAVSRACDGGAP